jgi:rubrerythrin
MGLFTTYIAYSLGKRAQRNRDAQERWVQFGNLDECEVCGYSEEKHDDQGNCPTY